MCGTDYQYDPVKKIWVRTEQNQCINYSDGDEVEERIYDIISKAKDVSVASLELRKHITDWPSRYHLSPSRANLLRPFETILAGRLLEIGAGCGALTRYFGEIGLDVTAVEGSSRRAEIASLRCRGLDNVQVFADNIENFSTNENGKYDIVTLIGVLEYARLYIKDQKEDPVISLLKIARQLVKETGILIVALENQLGLRYFAGNREDHISIPMYGINDLYTKDSAVTFGRVELETCLSSAGFSSANFYAPFPDYKLPSTILSPCGLKSRAYDLSPLLTGNPTNFYQTGEIETFSLEQAWKVIWRNKLVLDVANSFLVIASGAETGINNLHQNTLAFHYSVERRPEYMKESKITIDDDELGVISRLLNTNYKPQDMIPLQHEINARDVWINGTLWWDKLCEVVNTPGWSTDDVVVWAKVWMDMLKSEAKSPNNDWTADTLVEGKFIDATPFNLIIGSDSKGKFFDLEWRMKMPVKLGYIFFRGLIISFTKIHNVAEPAPDTPIDLVNLILKVAHKCELWLTESDVHHYVEYDNYFREWTTGLQDKVSFREVLKSMLSIRPAIASMQTMTEKLREQEDYIQTMTEKLREQEEYTRKILSSKSWSITNPLRIFKSFFFDEK
jgi:2-polyprenyl-3-methyl-5-hydroxy-6-metoxy-1,4-benzoquinol methylase